MRVPDAIHERICDVLDRANSLRITPENRILISGFWRSGTTWLQEVICASVHAKAVFEPFSLRKGWRRERFQEWNIEALDPAFLNAYVPYCPPGQLESMPATKALLDSAFLGACPRRVWRRRSLGECLSPRLVVKFTRAQLMLPELVRCYNTRAVHIYRDPRAVVASIVGMENGNWAKGAFKNLPLRQHLLRPGPARVDFFFDWEQLIDDAATRSDAARIAAFYCLLELYVRQSVQALDASRFRCVSYDDLLRSGAAGVLELLSWCQWNRYCQQSDIPVNRQSSTDWNYKGQPQPVQQSRSDRWRSVLSPQEVSEIEGVVKSFGLEDRLVGD